jgi:hypothetical protein
MFSSLFIEDLNKNNKVILHQVKTFKEMVKMESKKNKQFLIEFRL